MSRNQNKINNTQSTPQTQRRFISPNQLKPSDNRSPNPKPQEYRSSEPRGKEDPSSNNNPKGDKSKSQLSSEGPSRSNTQRDKIGTNPIPDRSRSKERKDYMTSNLARMTRKKDQKLSSSNVSERSNPQSTSKGGNNPQSKQQRYIYTFKEETKNKTEKVAQEYAPMPSSIDKVDPSAGSQLSPLLPSSIGSKTQKSNLVQQEKDISEIRQNSNSNNTSVAISSKGRQLQVNTVRYQDRSNIKNESRDLKGSMASMSREIVMPQQTINEPIQIQNQGISFKKIIDQNPKEQLLSFNTNTNQRQDQSVRIRRLQSQKQILQQQNSHLLQQKYHLQGETAFLQGKSQQLQREVEALRQSLTKINRDSQRLGTNNQRMFLELQERYNALLQEYRGKAKSAADALGEVAEFGRKKEELSNALRGLEEQNHLLRMELEKVRKMSQAKLLQAKQQSEFQMKQLQIRFSNQNRHDYQKEESFKQLQRELTAKDKELSNKQTRIQQLEFQLRDRDELEGLLHVKQTENQQIFTQLNKTKELLYKANSLSGETLQKMAIQLKEKQKTIRELTQTASHAQSQTQMQKLSLSAHNDLFGGVDSSSFQDLIRSHSDQTNKLRSHLSEKQEEIFQLTTQGEELTQRVRRLEQELQLNSRTYAVNLANANQVRQATELMLKKRISALESLRNVH